MRQRRRGQDDVALLAALHHDNGVVAGQRAVDVKSIEIPALPLLLDSFDLTDTVFTADALHCQRATAAYITGRGGHYVLTVKSNQPGLRRMLKSLPWKNIPTTSTVDTSHGRRVRQHQSRRSTRLDRLPRRRPSPTDPPHPNRQRQPDDRGRLRHLLSAHDHSTSGYRGSLDPRTLVDR